MSNKLKLNASYDDIADVLYLTSSRGATTRNFEEEAGFVLRYDVKTTKPVGATILDYKEYWLPQRGHLVDSISKSFGITTEDANRIIKSAS